MRAMMVIPGHYSDSVVVITRKMLFFPSPILSLSLSLSRRQRHKRTEGINEFTCGFHPPSDTSSTFHFLSLLGPILLLLLLPVLIFSLCVPPPYDQLIAVCVQYIGILQG